MGSYPGHRDIEGLNYCSLADSPFPPTEQICTHQSFGPVSTDPLFRILRQLLSRINPGIQASAAG